MPSFRWSASFVGSVSLLCAWPALLGAAEPDIGVFTAVEGRVSVQHAQSPEAVSAKLRDTVLFKDLIETQEESHTKALLNDDSILTVGEHSRVEITEHLYDPNRSLRSVVVNLVQGKVRALVGKVFTGSGSKFEVHTPTAVAAARGTYFVVWHVEGASGVANIGNHGDVDFHSGGRMVSVAPGTYSLTPPGGGPPSQTPGSAPGSGAGLGSGSPLLPTSTVVPNVTVPAVISGAASPPSPPPPSPPPPRFHPIPIDPSKVHQDNGLHLGQQGLQPGHGNPTPGNNQIPPGQGGKK